MILGRQVLCLMAFALLASSSPGGGSQVVLRVVALSAEQEPLPPPAAAGPGEQYLVEHNAARATVKVGPLRWSPKLATTASRLVRYQRMEKKCNFVGDLAYSQYGANQARAAFAAGPAEAVRVWVEGAKYYNYANNTCARGHECGTYKQVVWRSTAEVGCAQAVCGSRGPTLTICLYFPPGNVVREKPY